MADERTDQGFVPPQAQARKGGPRKPPAESTVLVTGATGFIGPHVVRALLDSGRRVIAFDLRPFAPEGEFILGEDLGRVSVELGSVADVARLSDVVKAHRPDEIVHMGMIIDPAYLAKNRTTGIEVNILGTVNVLEAALAFDVDRIINFSSIGVLPSVEYEPIDANHPVILATKGPGTDFYGSAKAASELLCYAYHQSLGVDFRTIRPSAVYGLGMTIWVGPIKAFVEGAVRGEPVHIEFGGPHPRDYTHARDIASLVVAVLAAPDEADRVFYGATGRPLTTTSELVAIVRDVVPGADVSVGNELGEGEELVVGLRGRVSVDNARAQLGWEPTYGSLHDGVAQYVQQYRSFLESR